MAPDHNVSASLNSFPIHKFIHVGLKPVIRINKCNEVASCMLYASVAGRPQAGVHLMNNLYIGMAPGVRLGNFAATIRRAIIDTYNFNILEGLIKDTVQAFRQISLHLIDWNYYAQNWITQKMAHPFQ